MSKAEAFLSNIVQMVGRIHTVQENLVAVKLHLDAISIIQFTPKRDEWRFERLITRPLGKTLSRAPLEENYSFLIDQLSATRTDARVFGVDTGISIPASLFDTRILTLPYMLADDLAEEAQTEGFWEEQDPEINSLEEQIVRYQILHANANEDNTIVLLSAIPEAIVKRYINLLIDADLMPVFIENESFSLINGIYTRLPAEKIQNPILILHLCPSHNMLIGCMRGRFAIQKIPISEFDEALLLGLAEIDDIGGEFWDEIAIRIGEQINQAIAYLQEERDFPSLNILHVVSEHKNLDNMLNLLRPHINNIHLEYWNALDGMTIASAHVNHSTYFQNNSAFTSAIGLATQSINITGKNESDVYRRFIDLNFLPNVENIRRNRRFAALNKLMLAGICFILAASFLLIGVNNVPTLIQSNKDIKVYEEVTTEARIEELRKTALEKRLKEKREASAIVRDLAVPRGYIIFMSKLATLLPPQAELETLVIDAESNMTLTGYSKTSVAINKFADNIVRNGLAAQAPIEQSRNGDLFAFTITATLIKRD